jgi:DNA-binding response OmpR family regulator
MQAAVARPTNAEQTDRDAILILVVDDDAKILQLVRAYLEREGFAVVTARDGMTALATVRERHPRLVVLDLMLPELDGLAVMRAVREESSVPILMLSARGSTAERVHGISEGADDYLAKPFSPAELVVRVKAILRRSATAAEGATGKRRLHDLVIDLDRHQVWRDRDRIVLTAAEFRLLVALAQADGRVLTREALLDTLYGTAEGEILDRTVDVYVGRLRDKLGDDAEQPRYVATVRGVGYRAALDK